MFRRFARALVTTTLVTVFIAVPVVLAQTPSPEPSGVVSFRTFPADPATLGAIADGLSMTCGASPGAYRLVRFPTAGLRGTVMSVKLTVTITHSWVGDLDMDLVSPDDNTHVIFSRTGATTATSCGDSSDLAGPYVFHDGASAPPSGGWWQAATAAGAAVPVASGNYRTTAAGGAGQVNPAPATLMNPVFAGDRPNGLWTLRIRDVSQPDTGTITAASISIATTAPFYGVNHDFDGDFKTDFAVGRCTPNPCPAPGTIYVQRSTDAGTTAITFGLSSDSHPWVDHDGDGRTDAVEWRPGASAIFHVLRSVDGVYAPVAFGTTGDSPYAVGDYDRDGRHDYAVFRPSSGTWYVLRSALGFMAQPWGLPTDKVTPGDFDGDGFSDFGIKRSGVFHILGSTTGYMAAPWGLQSDQVPPGDYDGDGKTDLTAIRNDSGLGRKFWYIRNSADGSLTAVEFGFDTDSPAPGDYDGDGRMDIAVWRAGATAYFYVLRSSDGAVQAIPWGQTLDGPMAAFLVR